MPLVMPTPIAKSIVHTYSPLTPSTEVTDMDTNALSNMQSMDIDRDFTAHCMTLNKHFLVPSQVPPINPHTHFDSISVLILQINSLPPPCM